MFGGAFDPVHEGHFNLAQTAVKQLELDVFFWVPSFDHPQKPPLKAPFQNRVEMLEVLLKGRPEFRISQIESHLEQPSYTINTLRELRLREFKNDSKDLQSYLLIGSDNLAGIKSWFKWETLLEETKLLVYPRETHLDKSLEPQINERVEYLDAPLLPYSSTQIRNDLRNNSQPSGLDPAVYDYIKANNLYGTN